MIPVMRRTVMANSNVDGGTPSDLPAGGHPRKSDMRAAMNGILYLLHTGCPLALPAARPFSAALDENAPTAVIPATGIGPREATFSGRLAVVSMRAPFTGRIDVSLRCSLNI